MIRLLRWRRSGANWSGGAPRVEAARVARAADGWRAGWAVGASLPFVLLFLVTSASVWHWSAPWRDRRERSIEERQCALRLRGFHRAFEAYRRDHGSYPENPLRLYPRYLRSLDLFVCPAYRRGRFSIPVLMHVKDHGLAVRDTYYFPYQCLMMTDCARRFRHNRIPLMYCSLHAEALYEQYHRQLVTGAARPRFLREYGVPHLLVLRQNGAVDRVNDLAVPLSGGRGPGL